MPAVRNVNIWRRLALGGAVLALIAIGLRPTWRRLVSSGEAILVTPGADATAVRRLVDSLGGAIVFDDPAQVAPRSDAIRRLHVAGWGLDTDGWSELGAVPVVLHPAPAATGFARVSWTAQLVLGDALVVEGHVSGHATVALADPAGRFDSTRTRADGGFQLEVQPRGTGRQLYVLLAGPVDRPVARETLAVNVITPPHRRVLILESAPRFETSALRNWLGRRGAAVAIRTAVSRARYRTEFVNRDRVALTPLTSRLLGQFDVVQIDGRALAGLGAAERATLRRAVAEDGLGVLIVPDTTVFDPGVRFSDRSFFLAFALRRVRDLDERTVRPGWAGLRTAVTAAVPAEPFVLEDRLGIESLIDDGTGGAAAQVAPRGAGRVGLSLVTEPARWLRTGQRDAYSAYWSRLLAALTAGSIEIRFVLETTGPWLVNRALVIRALGPGDHPVATVTPPSGVPDTAFLARDPLSPATWLGVYWPRETGWHRVGGITGATFWVQASSAWLARQSSERLDAAARYAVDQPLPQPPGSNASTPLPIPLGWFFGLFLLCAAVLWSARRPLSVTSGNATATTS